VFNFYALEKNFLDKDTLFVIRKYYDNKLAGGSWGIRQNEPNVKGHDASHFNQYADPLIEIILEEKTEKVSKIVGKRLAPTYSYARVYIAEKNDILLPHTDRPSCEYSVTVNVAYDGKPWPIWMKSPNGEAVSFILESGDAVIYKGCEVEHWRNPMIQHNCKANAQFMLHYVDSDGPNSEYKFDKRSTLGAVKGSGGT